MLLTHCNLCRDVIPDPADRMRLNICIYSKSTERHLDGRELEADICQDCVEKNKALKRLYESVPEAEKGAK